MSVFTVPPESKKSVRAAGKAISHGTETYADVLLVDQWRASHAYVINTFQAFLKRRIERSEVEAEFAQRLKRRKTVIDKLKRKRPDGTPLIGDVTSMNDLAGCRLIFADINDLERFRKYVHSTESMSNVNHKLRYDLNKYDYIEHPKPTGYRGIHDVFQHVPRPHRRDDESSKPWHNLLVEVQYRTRVQHAWATALEISDIIDGQRTKFALNEDDRVRFFALASEILARIYEGKCQAYLGDTTEFLIDEFRALEDRLGILQRLDALRQFGGFEDIRWHNVLNIVSDDEESYHLEVLSFASATKAVAKTAELETDPRSLNAVYVRADNPSQLRSAYRNYFNDPVDFVQLVREAIRL